ncbi:MAG: sel1 repeat family protein, partial [Myxococcales bacterium]|nr:sel1 repeat family protein [Myxococcales bacterium]
AELVAHLLFAVFSALFASQLELAPEHDAPVRRLVLVTRAGRTFRLAEADLPAEQASLDALLGSIRGRLGLDAPQPRTVRGDVLGCATCGAPLAADDAPTVRCASCGHPSPVPEELRARIRAHRAVADAGRTTEAAVRGLLEQPGAGRVNALLAAAAVVCPAAWVLFAVPVFLVGPRNAGGFEVGWMLAGGALVVVGAFLLARAALAARRALRLLASSFGARAPVAPGASPGCRRCGAPLPATEALVVGCAYCQAENVLGIDLRAAVAPTVEHALSLADLLRARSREASSRRRGALVALVAALAAGGMGVVSMSVAREHAARRARCTAGDAEACLRVGADFDLGLAVAEDDVAALDWYARGCELGEAEACDRAANELRWGTGVERDLVRQKAYRARACALGWAEACANDD